MPAPMVESNRSANPRLEQTFKSVASSIIPSAKVLGMAFAKERGFSGVMVMCFSAPLEFKNAREMSTIFFPFQCITKRGVFVTVATGVASRFSSFAKAMKASWLVAATKTAIRSWDSLMASSVPSNPSYFLGTAFKSISTPSANSPMATETPPAPKSLHRLIMRDAAGLRKSRCNFLSSGAFPFCTSAPQVSREDAVWDLEDPVAPPQPSLPVLPPTKMITSPAAGV